MIETNFYFVVGNVKCHPFILLDKPLDGFELIYWDAWTLGTLWKLDIDEAALTVPGHSKVHGQVWRGQEDSLLKRYCGEDCGLTRRTEIDIVISDCYKLKANTFILNNINSSYKKLEEGKWRF